MRTRKPKRSGLQPSSWSCTRSTGPDSRASPRCDRCSTEAWARASVLLQRAIHPTSLEFGPTFPDSSPPLSSIYLGRRRAVLWTLAHPTGGMMANTDSRVTIHMAASLDGFIARKDGSVDWLETSDEFADGVTMDPEFVETFLKTIECYVMGSRTYETALNFEAKGFGWPYGDKPTFVLTSRDLPRTRQTVEFYSGDLVQLVNERLRPTFRSIWFVGGGA